MSGAALARMALITTVVGSVSWAVVQCRRIGATVRVATKALDGSQPMERPAILRAVGGLASDLESTPSTWRLDARPTVRRPATQLDSIPPVSTAAEYWIWPTFVDRGWSLRSLSIV